MSEMFALHLVGTRDFSEKTRVLFKRLYWLMVQKRLITEPMSVIRLTIRDEISTKEFYI